MSRTAITLMSRLLEKRKKQKTKKEKRKKQTLQQQERPGLTAKKNRLKCL